jgi:hypothetical protein
VSSSSAFATAGTAAFRLASRVRGERAIHARGRTLTGRLAATGGLGTGAPLLDAPGSYDVLVRFSRAIGLPTALPDVLGLAVRIVDAHGPGQDQDLLLDSTRPEPLLRRLPWPGRDLLGPVYGSLLPYEVAGATVLIGARPLPGQGSAGLPELPDELGLELLVATPSGPWRTWGVVRTTGRLPAPGGRQTRFNPWTTGGGIRPAGPGQRWRRSAYDVSHVAPDET